MGTVVVFSKDKVLELVNAGVINGVIDEDGDLILEKPGGVFVNLGNVKSHADLIGLELDHHTQYALADGSRGDFASEAQGVKADNARPNTEAEIEFVGDDVNGVLETITITDDETDRATWPDRLVYQFRDTPLATPRKTTYFNEYGELRVAPADYNTTAARFFVKETSTNPVTARSATAPVVELMDNRVDRNSLWALVGDGTTVVNEIRMAYTLVLGPADTVPAGTPAGTVIVRTT